MDGAQSVQLDLNIHTGCKVELHEGVDGLLLGLEDIENTLMRAYFKLFTRLFVDVRTAQDRVTVDRRRQWNRASYACAGALCALNDVSGCLV